MEEMQFTGQLNSFKIPDEPPKICNDPRAAGPPDRVVTDLILVTEKSEECSGCRRYLGYLNHENTNVYNYKFNN